MASAVTDKENYTAELQRRIRECFDIFDHESNKTVDVREVGTIVRSLKCCPSEGELSDIISEVEEEEPTGYIRYEKFEPIMLGILLEKKYQPATEESLLKAFEILNEDPSTNHISSDDIKSLMTKEGEPFTQEEMEEMTSAAVDPDKGVLFYREYVPLMVVDDTYD